MSQEKVTETFDRWADAGRDAGMEKEHGDVVEQVVEALDIQAGEKVLDLGCGNGWATRMLAKAHAGVQAVGLDASSKMIERAEELHSYTIRARYEIGSFEKLPFRDDGFDRVFSMEALYYTGDLAATLTEIHRVLKPGGRADVVLDYYKESPATEFWARKMGLELHWLGEGEWSAAFEGAGFEVATERVVDRRGPGDEAAFECDECTPDWDTRVAQHAAGSLWIQATKPA